MSKITYLKGDATQPIGEGKKIIIHICNDIGAFGAGFVLALSARWDKPEKEYRAMKIRELGDVVFVSVEKDLVVANMIAQHDVRPDKEGNPPIRYAALAECLKKVNDFAKVLGATIHAPKIGAGLAGGSWEMIQEIISANVTDVDVYIYEFK